MPIVVSQVVDQVPTTDAVSPDGRIRATVMPNSAGVFIRVDYTDLLGVIGYDWPNPFRITLWKQSPDGTVSAVRGADSISQYGAIFHAYDDEVTFGQQIVYWAEAPTKSGDQIVETQKVAVLTWEPDGGFRSPGVWIKNLEDPDLSTPARCIDWSAGAWASRNATADVWGASQPAVTTDVRKSYNTAMQVLTKDEDEYQALLAAIDASVVYVVGLERHRRRTGYYLVGDIAPSRVGPAYSGYDAWTIGLTGMGRPVSAGHSLAVPGKSYADRRAAFETYQLVKDYGQSTPLNANPNFEAGVTDGNQINATVSRVNTPVYSGSWAGKIVSGTGSSPRAETAHMPVVPGRSYRAVGHLQVPQSTPGGIEIDTNFFDASHNYMTTRADFRSNPAQNTWIDFDKTNVAPAGAAYASIAFVMGGTPGAGLSLFADDLMLLAVRRYSAGVEPY
jgi:hypothetical protein